MSEPAKNAGKMEDSVLQKYNLNIDSDSDDDSDAVDEGLKVIPKAAMIHIADLTKVITRLFSRSLTHSLTHTLVIR